MDLFGHAALSLLAGRAVAREPAERRATTAVALTAGLLPDIDAVSYLGGADLFLAMHQRYTHNLLVMSLFPLVVGVVASRFTVVRWPVMLAAAYAGALLHLCADLVGIWPVPLAWPFGDGRFCLALLDQDFSWAMDVVLVVGAALSFWDPVAASPWKVRAVLVAAVAAALATLWVV